MKYIKQFSIILFLSFLGECLKWCIPLPIPASIYGLLLMLFGLILKIIPIHSVEETGMFFVEVMPYMFIPAGVGSMNSWTELKAMLLPVTVITVMTTALVMVVTGKVTQYMMKKGEKKEDKVL